MIVRKEELRLAEAVRLSKEIANFFNIDEAAIVPIYIQKYHDAFNIGENIILATGGPEMANGFRSCFLELKGQGCREFEVKCPKKDWKDLLIYFALNMEADIKRIDIAIDDFEGKVLTFDWLLEKLNAGCFTSSFQNRNFILTGNINTGRTITFGKHGSSLMLCIYEKLKEQVSKGIECNQEYWTRFEMRFGKDRANDFTYNFLKKTELEFKSYIMSVFYNMLDIKRNSELSDASSNLSHVKSDSKWLQFLGNVEKFKMERAQSIQGSYLTYENWARPLMSSYLLYLIFTNNKELYTVQTKMYQELSEYLENFDKRKLKHINSYLSNKSMPLVKLSDIEEFKVLLHELIEERKLPF